MKREPPAEREIADMIAPAFDRLPAPDARRLATVEQRLLEQPRLRGRTKFAWWWLAAALVAGAASALWWVVDYDSGKGQEAPAPAVTAPSVVPSAPDQSARPSRPEGAESKPVGGPANDRSPLIFKRER